MENTVYEIKDTPDMFNRRLEIEKKQNKKIPTGLLNLKASQEKIHNLHHQDIKEWKKGTEHQRHVRYSQNI